VTARRLLAPVALVALAVALGLLLYAPSKSAPPVSASLVAASPASSPASLADGQMLFAENCSSCHGLNAKGGNLAPNLRGVGAATVDLWVSSGWMPLSVPTAQPIAKPDRFTPQQTLDIANYLGTLYGGPPIPSVDLSGTSLSQGFSLFTLNCAPCHTITGAGDALSNGLDAPPLHGLTETQVAEAIETGPGNMPKFTPGALTKAEVLDVVAYVTQSIEHPSNPGGLGLGGVGPVAEGFIGLFIGVGACMLIALWIGERTEDEETHDEGGGAAHV